MSGGFDDVQRIVLRGSPWKAARHLMLSFGDRSPLHFLSDLLRKPWPSAAGGNVCPPVQVSLGFTRRGLEKAHVRDHVLSCFALKSPAYWAGAARRAASHLAMSDLNSPQHWDPPFVHTWLDAVLSVHVKGEDKGMVKVKLDDTVNKLKSAADSSRLAHQELPPAAALVRPPEVEPKNGRTERGHLVHFGYLDGLSRIGIRGWTKADAMERCLPISRHEAGEFVLGHVQDSGADPWVAGPRLRIWPEQVRAFFRNGSFGVLQQIQQDVGEFERFVASAASESGLSTDEIKGKLCGRYPNGTPLATPKNAVPHTDFDYEQDRKGHGCPFGSHVRRMNPRLSGVDNPGPGAASWRHDRLAHAGRSRPLIRRGLPYGPHWTDQSSDTEQRGLIGQFFCASIEDQFEHLLGEWAERVPLGSPDGGGARDPLIGAHEAGDGPFEIPKRGSPALRLDGLVPFTRTIGAAYLFYPSLTTLRGIADSCLWGADDDEDDA